MTNSDAQLRSLPPGGGDQVRRSYTRILIISITATALVLGLYLAAAIAAAPDDATVVTFIAGGAAATVASVLLVAAVLKGRTAVTTDTRSLPAVRTSGSLAIAAQTAGAAGIAAAVVLAVVLTLSGVDLAVTTSVVTGITSAVPMTLGAAVLKLSRRLSP